MTGEKGKGWVNSAAPHLNFRSASRYLNPAVTLKEITIRFYGVQEASPPFTGKPPGLQGRGTPFPAIQCWLKDLCGSRDVLGHRYRETEIETFPSALMLPSFQDWTLPGQTDRGRQAAVLATQVNSLRPGTKRSPDPRSRTAQRAERSPGIPCWSSNMRGQRKSCLCTPQPLGDPSHPSTESLQRAKNQKYSHAVTLLCTRSSS